jgi:hypothetical protein
MAIKPFEGETKVNQMELFNTLLLPDESGHQLFSTKQSVDRGEGSLLSTVAHRFENPVFRPNDSFAAWTILSLG